MRNSLLNTSSTRQNNNKDIKSPCLTILLQGKKPYHIAINFDKKHSKRKNGLNPISKDIMKTKLPQNKL